ncbi:hypothetical protein PMSM_18045 [Paenibacillus macquariensis subsp. macquariensis]|uniref:Copper amine oxidase N-terminal domain-containing protein n=1 Tax=Paenibacillus macquariensis TaxID=948756 RepID=A0ABY1KBJ6_9BACL|nr:stalk domain-containing protein [Paenibacillus macquariensis]OAB32159.1 hypothetical protein PMSM_18045 [Paenibacillus macquariensis subsp. macquariensis]SIR55439.1 Copper amine oxidase N-terminal domain-containing protein [Paenibacillus macquariensis]
MEQYSHLRQCLRNVASLGLLLLVSMGSATSVVHADTTSQPFQITVDGAWIQGEGTSFQRNGTIMIPIRVVAEAIGATVSWILKSKRLL